MPSHLVQLLFALIASIAVLAVLGFGTRLRRAIDSGTLRKRFVLIGAILMLLVDVPIGHGPHCGMAPSGHTISHFGIWWIPYAVYSFTASVCAVRLLARDQVKHRASLVVGSAGALLCAVGLDRATQTMDQLPWWTVHLILQLALLVLLWRSISSRLRLSVMALPLLSCLVPFLPLSFWHACARIRIGDSVEEVTGTLDRYWLIPNPSGDTSDRLPVKAMDSSTFLKRGRLLFAATDGVHADTCEVRLQDGRVVSFELSPD